MSGFYVYITIVSTFAFVLTGIAVKLYRRRKCPRCKKKMAKIKGEYFFLPMTIVQVVIINKKLKLIQAIITHCHNDSGRNKISIKN